MPDPKVESAVEQATSILDAGGGNTSKAGRDALDHLKTIAGLTPDQRKEAIVATATHAASHGCDESLSSPNLLLRNDTQYTAFIKNVINDYSAEFQEAVRNSAQEVSNQMARQMPQVGIITQDNPTPKLNTDNMPRPGFRPAPGTTMDEQDVAAWDLFYEQGGKLFVQAQTDNLSKLDPVALETLQACETTARDKFQHLEPEELETVVNSMNVNNVMLRVSTPVVTTKLTTDTDLPEDQQKLQRACNLRLAQLAQTYLNGSEGTQTAIITRQMRADAAFTQATDNQLKAACQGQLQSTVSISALEKLASDIQVAKEAQKTEAAGKISVRDALRSAGSSISNAASTVKNSLADRVDAARISRLDSQIKSRQDHGNLLEERQLLLEHIKQASKEERRVMVEALSQEIRNESADSIITGSNSKASMDMKDKLDLWTMDDDSSLDKAITKNAQRMDRNDKKLDSLSRDKQKIEEKVEKRHTQSSSSIKV